MTAHTRIRRKLRCAAGITFVEAIVASGIMILALSSVLALASRSFQYLSDIRMMARSAQVLQQKMEDIRLLSWSSMQTMSNTWRDAADTNGVYAGKVIMEDFDTYAGTVVVERVTLVVTWTNRSSRVVTNSLTTLISNGGLNRYFF